MKTVNSLIKQRSNDDQKKAIRSVVAKLKRRGFKPHPHSKSMIRVHIEKRYFVYSAITGKWATVKSSGLHKWHTSKDIDDFIKKAKEINAWVKQKKLEK